MPPLKVLFALAAVASISPQAASAQENPGALGAEGEPGRNPAMAGADAGSGHPGTRAAVSPTG